MFRRHQHWQCIQPTQRRPEKGQEKLTDIYRGMVNKNQTNSVKVVINIYAGGQVHAFYSQTIRISIEYTDD